MFGKRLKFDAQGCSELQVIKSPSGWFVGYYKQEDDGSIQDFRMGHIYPSYDQAEVELKETLRQQEAA